MYRRELLAAFLGLPVALAACRRTEAPLPAGEIVGASDVFGHRLRDGGRVEVPQDAWSKVPLVIVGGGVAGLTAAWRLQNSGFKDFAVDRVGECARWHISLGLESSDLLPMGCALHSRANEREYAARVAA